MLSKGLVLPSCRVDLVFSFLTHLTGKLHQYMFSFPEENKCVCMKGGGKFCSTPAFSPVSYWKATVKQKQKQIVFDEKRTKFWRNFDDILTTFWRYFDDFSLHHYGHLHQESSFAQHTPNPRHISDFQRLFWLIFVLCMHVHNQIKSLKYRELFESRHLHH